MTMLTILPFVVRGRWAASPFNTGKGFRDIAQKRYDEHPETSALDKGSKEQEDDVKESMALICDWI
ncbi:hypothetical protein PG994_006628 [Apiospora phragmitis]|uniref:Uncharacterized protein n=1 Tax=Apiospora phragmitis TaxID=2905665 RepID=A0ABR1VGK4_9PEZI